MNNDEKPTDPRVFTWVSGSEVKPVRVDWWERHLIPRGCLTLAAGRGNAGKSTTCAAWAAEATNRGETVAWLHSEEDRSMHIVPKLLAANADIALVKFLDVGIRMDDGEISEASLQLPRDLERLENGLIDLGCRWLVFDALTSFKSSRMSANSGDDVRAFLEPIQRMAGRLNAVVIGIAHLGKDAERKARDSVKGASEWTDVPRQVLAFHRDDAETEGVISDVKGNLSPSPRSVGYRFESISLPEHSIDEVGRVVFTGDVDTNVDAERRSAVDDDQDDRSEALRWVEDYLEENGETDAATVKRLGSKELCTSVRTIERSIKAKDSRVTSVSKGFPRKAFWRLVDIIDGEVVSSDTTPADDTPTTSLVVATVATGSDQAKRDVATGVATEEKPSSDKAQNSVATTDTSPICPYCGEALIYDDDKADGFHTSRSKCVRVRAAQGGRTPLHAVPDSPPRTSVEWLHRHLTELLDAGTDAVESVDVYRDGQAAGFKIDALRQAAKKSDLISVTGRRGAVAIWRLGAGGENTIISCETWLLGWLHARGWVKAADAYTAGQSAGYGRTAVKSAAQSDHVLKRGQSIATEWSLDPTYTQESA